ncbi:MAG: glycosyltransferase family 39 protein [Acidobacteria bacterium]|nr:glycosyltransferase family 39 protein [Acidobacteriota bacterium]
MTSRFRSPLAAYGWWLWLAFGLYLTVGPFWWHVEYFSSPGPQYYRLILWLLPALAGAVLAYTVIRKRGLWRHEPLLFAALLLAGCLLYEPRSTAVLLLMLAASYGIGKFCLDRLGVVTHSHAEDIALSAAVGMAFLTVSMFLLGLADAYYAGVMWVLLAAPCLLFFGRLRDLASALRGALAGWRGDAELARPLTGVAMAFAGVFMICTMMFMLSPTISADAMLFHLAEVRHYAEVGGLEPVPAMPYSYYPQGGEVLMTLAYITGGQMAAQMVNPLFFVLSLLLLYALARRLGLSRPAAVMGVVAAATIPFLHWTGGSFKNDFMLVLYQLGALHCFLRYREERADHWIYVGVFLLASSFGVKHTAVFGAAPLGLLYLTIVWRRPRLLAMCLLIGVTFGFYWHARTYQLTGNPLYPRVADDAGKTVSPRRGDRPPAHLLYLMYPWVTHFKGVQTFESPSNNPCGIFLVLFGPLFLWVRRKKWSGTELICVFAVVVHLAYLGYVWLIVRYAIVPFCILAVLTASRLTAFYESAGRLIKGSLLAAVAYSFLFALLPAMISEINAPQLLYFAGRLDREQYLRQTLTYYTSIEYLWANVPQDALILSVNNAARGYSPSPGRFHFATAKGRNSDIIGTTAGYLAERDYDYAVIPTMMNARFQELIAERYQPEREYADDEYTVFRLRRRRGLGL